MKINRSAYQGFGIAAIVSMLAIALAGCSGNDGSQGPPGPPGPPGASAVAAPTDATALAINITSVTINSPPVVNFTVTNQNGVPVAGLVDADLRFNIAKLVRGTNGDPSKWQNYINRVSSGAVQGSQERFRTQQDYPWGKLTDNKNGTYTYTFCTDITNNTGTPDLTKCSTAPQPNACPAPCTDADGKALDISYQPTLPHRISIQQANAAYPKSNATYDFVPTGGAVTDTREIVKTANCNVCHNQLSAHGGTRIETKLCVTCHNPGSWVAGTPNTTVDFKVYIHKIHRGENLPSVVGPDGILGTADDGTYKIGNADFSDVVFPQDIRNCTKCHTGSDPATPDGDNWETQPSIAACGSCHDNIDFSKAGPPCGTDPNGHPGCVQTDNSQCITCHATGKIAGSIAEKHSFPAKLTAEGAKYKLNIVSVTNTAPTLTPTIKFSITNPTNNNAAYDIANTPAITGGSMSLIIGWNTTDFSNDGRSNAQPISISLLSSGALAGTVTNNGDGTYSVTSATAIPAAATGTGRVGFYARMSVDVDGDATKDTIQVKSVVKDFPITDSTAVARRTVVDIAKCDKCHERLSLHGGARTDEPQLCVMCHNPNATDLGRRPRADLTTASSPGPCAGQVDALNNPALANAINCNPAAGGSIDSKKEQAIDFKRMIHGIHAGAQTTYAGVAARGFREKGLVVYGFYSGAGPVNPVDFSDVRFPGILNDCTTCHITPTSTNPSYQLTGIWESPAQSGVLGSTIDSAPLTTDSLSLQTDDLNISPTAAVCSSCHDSTAAQNHMIFTGLAQFSGTQADILNGNAEICSICHGPGRTADVKVVHGVK